MLRLMLRMFCPGQCVGYMKPVHITGGLADYDSRKIQETQFCFTGHCKRLPETVDQPRYASDEAHPEHCGDPTVLKLTY